MLKKIISTKTFMPDRKNSGLGRIFTAMILLFMVAVSAWAEQTTVKVTAPKRVSGAFAVTIDIANALDLDSGQFDLEFDPDMIRVMDVTDGSIAGITIPVALWSSLGPGRIRVLFNLPGVQGINGTGYLVRIHARAIGKMGDVPGLTITKGLLVNKQADRIPAEWINGNVKIQTYVPDSDSVPAPKTRHSSDPETIPHGISISTPMAVGGLVALTVAPGLFLFLFRRRRKRK
ncbi:MAG: hypothetical protein D3904_01550 [Candidatus Electrothrix sp. EH2]|nr:hypothetical protein [Candidatus Electrothrix sp. EH2]